VHGGRERQERIVANTVQLMGLGGSLRAASSTAVRLSAANKSLKAATCITAMHPSNAPACRQSAQVQVVIIVLTMP
jgi:hypothetical protein